MTALATPQMLHPAARPEANERTQTRRAADRTREHPDEFLVEIERHKDAFYRFVRRTVWNPTQVEDVFSSAVLAAYENRHKYTPGTNFRAWMFRILLNKCYVANRESARHVQPLDSGMPDVANGHCATDRPSAFARPEDVLELCGDRVRDAFRLLSTAEKACILLRGVEDMTYNEIAETMQIPAGTVMTHLHRGRTKLRNALGSYRDAMNST